MSGFPAVVHAYFESLKVIFSRRPRNEWAAWPRASIPSTSSRVRVPISGVRILVSCVLFPNSSKFSSGVGAFLSIDCKTPDPNGPRAPALRLNSIDRGTGPAGTEGPTDAWRSPLKERSSSVLENDEIGGSMNCEFDVLTFLRRIHQRNKSTE